MNSIKAGDDVVCVDSGFGYDSGLTHGKIYNVIEVILDGDFTYYKIKDNNGELLDYLEFRFEKPKHIIRNETIDYLLK